MIKHWKVKEVRRWEVEKVKKQEVNFVMRKGKMVNSVCFCVTKISRLMAFSEIVAFYSDNHAKHTHIPYMYRYVHIEREKCGDSEYESRWFTYLPLCFRAGLSDLKLLRGRIVDYYSYPRDEFRKKKKKKKGRKRDTLSGLWSTSTRIRTGHIQFK